MSILHYYIWHTKAAITAAMPTMTSLKVRIISSRSAAHSPDPMMLSFALDLWSIASKENLQHLDRN